MAFWSTEKLDVEIQKNNLISDFDSSQLKHGAVELNIGKEFYISSSSTYEKRQLEAGQFFHIPPGQIGLLITHERVKIPNNAIGLISIKAGTKFRGLVNISGFHVDPGFEGHLKFSVYNAGPQNIIFEVGKPLFLLWFCSLDDKTNDTYKGVHNNQSSISPDDVTRIQGQVHSPASLDYRLSTVESQINIIKTISIGLFIALVIFLLTMGLQFVNVLSASNTSSPSVEVE